MQDKSLWREVNLLPYKVELRKLWKLVRAHLSDRLRILRVRGLLDFSKFCFFPLVIVLFYLNLRFTVCSTKFLYCEVWIHVQIF